MKLELIWLLQVAENQECFSGYLGNYCQELSLVYLLFGTGPPAVPEYVTVSSLLLLPVQVPVGVEPTVGPCAIVLKALVAYSWKAN